MVSPMQRVEICWLDAADHEDTWVSQKDAEDFNDSDYEVKSIGYLVKRTEKYITIASDIGVDGTLGTVRKIPLGMVTGVVDL